MAFSHELGKKGESLASDYLKRLGYVLLHTNWRFHRYELDLIAQDGEELVVVEVKTRSADFLVEPYQAVDRRKIRRIAAATDAYIRKYQPDLTVRFDVICLVRRGSNYEIEHIKDAFFAPLR